MRKQHCVALLLALGVSTRADAQQPAAPVPLTPAVPIQPGTPAVPVTPPGVAPNPAATPGATPGATAPAAGKPATPPDPDTALLTKFSKTVFDRRPSTILEQWGTPEAEAEPEETPGTSPPAKPKDAQDLALESLARDVTRGEWPAVAEFFTARFEDSEKARKAYSLMLDALARQPRATATPSKPTAGGAPPQPRPSPNSAFREKNLLMPGDILGLADACPGELDRDTHIPKLAALLRGALARGQFPDGLVETLATGTAKLGGADDPAKRDLAARLLIAAGLPQHAGDFLPQADSTQSPEDLDLLGRYHLAMHAREPKNEHLAAAWGVTQTLLSHPEVKQAAKEKALAQAVSLAPRVEKELGARWLGESFTGDAELGREVLATIGAMTSRGRAEPGAESRLHRLELQKTAIDSLLATPGLDIAPWREVLTLLALNWLDEGEHTRRYDVTTTLTPQMRWDPFGNMYYDQRPQTRAPSNNNIPRAIATGELLKARPGEEWLKHIDADLRPKFAGLYAQLLLKVNEPEEAFPFIERVAVGHPETGKKLAEEFLRLWADKNDPNSSRNRTYRYGYMYGYNQRANSIPLTRSKQERNLAELARWVVKIKSLPIEPIDQKQLAQAFTKIHSSAEVYRPEAIAEVFGDFEGMEPETLAALAGTMRQNLASVWRDPRVQQANKTKRKDKEILAEVAAGYQTAYGIVLDALERHPEDWRLWLARGTIAFDRNNFAQENGGAPEFVAQRTAAFEILAKAAGLYASELPEDEGEETTEAFEHWFYAALGAADLGALKENHQPAPAEFPKIQAALEALAEPAGERHMARFANALAARISSVKPELKQRYLKHGLGIVGKHEKAAEARKVFEYYADLVSEIQLVAKVDGPDTVGHGEPFGLVVDIHHTKEIERESGGFAKYLTNQNNQSYAYNYGRPTQNYREKFEQTARAALEEGFEVLSVTFHDSKVGSRGTGRPGWRTTPYAYLLVRARGPEVDRIPPLQIDLDFLDTSGFVILPVATAAIPIDARGESAPQRQADELKITQTLDERDAGEGKLSVEVKATARGLVPALERLLDTEAGGFELVSSDGGDLTVFELDGESDEAAAISERTWTLTYEAGGPEAPEQFTFPRAVADGAQVEFQRYDDADMVAAEQTITLQGDYGKSGSGMAIAAVIAVIALLGIGAFLLFRPRPDEGGPSGVLRYAVPEEVTPFTVISLLRRIRDENNLPADSHSQLAESIDELERHYFDRSGGAEPDLRAVAEEWVRKAA